jgi:AcrR family transcriptional regulator
LTDGIETRSFLGRMPSARAQSIRTAQEQPKTAADRGKEVRQRLLSAAVELIPELGWNAVSTRILAQRAGLAAGLVHYHFESLQALLRQASIASMRDALQAIEVIFEQAETLESGLDMLIGALDTYTREDPSSLLFVEAYLASLRDIRLAAELAGLLVDFRQRFAEWLRSHRQAQPEATAAVLAAALDGILLHRALGPDLSAGAIRQVLGRVLVRTEPPRHRSPKTRKGTDTR